jgi:hypothetical protein
MVKAILAFYHKLFNMILLICSLHTNRLSSNNDQQKVILEWKNKSRKNLNRFIMHYENLQLLKGNYFYPKKTVHLLSLLSSQDLT